MSSYKHTVKTICKFCRKEFDSFGLKKVCFECDSNMETYFQSIKAYLNEFPDSTLPEICSDLNIPSALIKFYLKEERLEIKKSNDNYFLKCEKCGKAITTGRFCSDCEIIAIRSEMQGYLVTTEDNLKMEKDIVKFYTSNHKYLKR